MTTTTIGLGWIEVLLVLLGGGGLLGMPPGQRDASLLKAAPQQSLVFVEWASRGAGKPGAPGVDGFAADPEIRLLLSAIDAALQQPPSAGEDEFDQSGQPREAIRLARLMTAYPGCFFLTADAPVARNGLLNVPTPTEILARLHACVIVNAGAEIPLILEGLKQVTHEEIPTNPQMYNLPAPNGARVTIHQEGDRLLVGLGTDTVERALAGIRGEVPGIDSNPRFQAGWKRVATDRAGSIGWVDVRGSTAVAITSMGPAGLLVQTVLRGAGADALDYMISGTGVVEGNVVQRTFLATNGRTDGVLLMAGGPALRMEQLSHIPADSDLVLAASLDLGQLVGGLRDLVAKTNPLSLRVFDEATKELEKELGLSLGQDVFPALGNAWTAFSSPSEGGQIGSSLIVAVEVRDQVKAQAVYERLLQLLEQSLTTEANPEFAVASTEIKRQEFQGHTITYLNRSEIGFGMTPAAIPSLCLTPTHLLFAVHPQALKAHLRQREVKRPGFGTVNRAKLSLAAEELLIAGYFDGAKCTQTLGGLFPFLGLSLREMAQNSGWEFDPFIIPSAAALVPYAGDVTISMARQKDGLLFESRNPQIGIALLTTLSWVRSWFQADYELLLDARRLQAAPADNGGLGAPDGQVVPAAAEKPAAPLKEKPADAVGRRVAPVLIRALVPGGVQPFIPDEVFRKLAEPPSPEVLKQREERRKLQEERRRERALRRGVPVQP